MLGINQRLYAILLRRILGPYLDDESLKQLHKSIDISLQEGCFILRDVSLRSEYISSHVKVARIRKIRIGTLKISLLLKENDDSNSSFAWRAANLGTSVALLASIELDDVEVHLNFDPTDLTPAPPATYVEEATSTRASTLSAYIDSILKSLRLTLNLTNVRIRLFSTNDETKYMELALKQAKYNDIELNDTADSSSDYRTILHKRVEVLRVTASFVEAQATTMIAQIEGATTFQFRAIEYLEVDTMTPRRIQNDIEIRIPRVQLFFDRAIVSQFIRILDERTEFEQRTKELNMTESIGVDQEINGSLSDVESDLNAISDFVHQYRQARAQVENNEMRGGMILPGDDEDTFDTFFDANDQSLISYSQVLRESIIGQGGTSGASNFVHTKVSIQCSGATLKLSFRKSTLAISQLSTEEYILVVARDLSFSAALSNQSMNYKVQVSSFELEDSVRSHVSLLSTSNEIGTVFYFPNSQSEHFDSGLLVNPPCLLLEISKSESNLSVDLAMEACEFCYREETLRNLQVFHSDISARASDKLESPEQIEAVDVSFRCEIQSLLFVLAVRVANEDIASMVSRDGRDVSSVVGSGPRLGVLIEDIKLSNSDDGTLSATAEYAILSAFVPKTQNSTARRDQRFDIACFCGAKPGHAIRISKVSTASDGSTSLFPAVPSLSTYKARQEEEDDDIYTPSSYDPFKAPGFYWCQIDPQDEMQYSAKRVSHIISIEIPEVTLDVSANEILCLNTMIQSISPNQTSQDEEVLHTPSTDQSKAIALRIDRLSVAIHESELSGVTTNGSSFFALEAQKLNIHGVLDASQLRECRVMLFDLDVVYSKFVQQSVLGRSLFSSHSVGEVDQSNNYRMSVLTNEDRRASIKERYIRCMRDRTFPIVHRSHLFSPISKLSPQLLIDFIKDGDEDFRLHVSVYHSTVRFQYKSAWIFAFTRLQQSLNRTTSPPTSDSDTVKGTCMHLKVHLSSNDCCLDYSSASHFKVGSRILLRIGDFRAASIILVPSAPVQALSVAVRDMSLGVCPTNHGYDFENSQLIVPALTRYSTSSAYIRRNNDDYRNEIVDGMKLRTLLTMDRLDCKTTISVDDRVSSLRLEVSAGEISSFFCKDSFSHLAESLGELVGEVSALDEVAIDHLRSLDESKQSDVDTFFDATEEGLEGHLVELNEVQSEAVPDEYLLDGYDWTTIDKELEPGGSDSEDELVARWSEPQTDTVEDMVHASVSPVKKMNKINIIHNHVPIDAPGEISFNDDEMGAAKYAGTSSAPLPKACMQLNDLKLKLRLFDGFDWPELRDIDPITNKRQKLDFLIESSVKRNDQLRPEESASDKLLKELTSPTDAVSTSTFNSIPLPSEKGEQVRKHVNSVRLSRRADKYVQLSASGVSLRTHAFAESSHHRLSSVVALKVDDFFVAESISSGKAIKMVGEWFSEKDHPRETTQGLLSLKMVSWHARRRLTEDGKVANDENESVMTLLPLRCKLDQKAIRFATLFFKNEEATTLSIPPEMYQIPPPIFRVFRVKTFKVKVDYNPQRLDSKALYNGAVVELVNLSPLDDLVLFIREVTIKDEVGIGDVAQKLVHSWVHDVTSTQLHKFLTNTRPLEPLTHLGASASDLIVLPWEAFKNGESVQRALRTGAASFAKCFAHETLTQASRVSEFIADQSSRLGSAMAVRPAEIPRNILDTRPHIVDSLSRGLQEAGYTIVIVPYREYQRSGPSGAMKSVIKGIPVAIAAPMSSGAEALSYALIGMRNQLNPDARKEEEISQRGLHLDGH